MKRVLFDAHVVLDVLLDRQPFVGESAAAWAAVETGRAEGILAAHSFTTIYYLLQKRSRSASAKRVFSAILKAFGVASVDAPVMLAAGCATNLWVRVAQIRRQRVIPRTLPIGHSVASSVVQ